MEFVGNTDKDFDDFCRNYECSKAPTVILFDEKMQELGRAHDLEEVKEMLVKHGDA